STRGDNAQQVIARMRSKLAKEAGATLWLRAVQDIRIGARQSDGGYQYSLLSDSLDDLRQWQHKIRRAFASLPELVDVNSDQQDKGAEMDLTYYRTRM
ncbi:efflux RND transporter permease subunit, partial [Erwinia amylovora]|uniref:efflux RND transporter permease subunit n=1 Tax=Erwinia amylovora TaxID=552 RepID=UPI00200B9DF6